MSNAQATAASAASSGAAPARTTEQPDLDKPTNTQLEKTREGRSAATSTQLVTEGPSGLADSNTSRANQRDRAGEDTERLQLLAYQLWQERGCPEGTPEIDWIEAVRICRRDSQA